MSAGGVVMVENIKGINEGPMEYEYCVMVQVLRTVSLRNANII